MNRRYLTVLLLFLIVGIVAAGFAVWQRYQIESSYRSVELAMSYDDLQSLARQVGKRPVQVMQMFREKGLTTILFKEPTVNEISNYGEFAVMTGRELLTMLSFSGHSSADLQVQDKIFPDDTCFLTSQEVSARQLAYHLKIKTGNVRIYTWSDIPRLKTGITPVANHQGAQFIICTSADSNSLKNLGLGFPSGPIQDSNQAGLLSILQIRNWPEVNAESLVQVFKPLEGVPNLSAIAFNENFLPGYPDLIRELASQINDLHVPLVQVEFFSQKGLNNLGLLLDGQVVRLHSVNPEEMLRYSPADLKSRFLLAATERNIRVLLIRPLAQSQMGNILDENLNFVAQLKQALEDQGLKTGRASTLSFRPVSPVLLFFMGLGVISGGMLLLHCLRVQRKKVLLLLVLALIWGSLLLFAMESGRKLMALAAVIIFPTLSLMVNINTGGGLPGRSILLFVRTTLFSLIGALFTAGLLADSSYMLKLNQFAGVKVAHALPLLILAGVFFFLFRSPDGRKGYVFGLSGPVEPGSNEPFWERLTRLLNQPVQVKWALVFLVLLVLFAIYVIRTGNEVMMPPSALEIKARTFLDTILGVRPRTKEFLLGHPLLLFLFYTGYKDNRFLPLLLLGAIGQISVVNTFAHIHTPLVVSLLRLFNGMWLGILLGLILIMVWNLTKRLYQTGGGEP